MAKVLLIDSDAAAVQENTAALAKHGIEVSSTADGNEGLTRARTFRPDVIVLCVELPRVSGYSICNKLKKDPELSVIALILTSSQATEETFEQHKKLKTRAEGYLKKPYTQAQLLAELGPFIGLDVPAARPAAAPVAAASEDAQVSRSAEHQLADFNAATRGPASRRAPPPEQDADDGATAMYVDAPAMRRAAAAHQKNQEVAVASERPIRPAAPRPPADSELDDLEADVPPVRRTTTRMAPPVDPESEPVTEAFNPPVIPASAPMADDRPVPRAAPTPARSVGTGSVSAESVAELRELRQKVSRLEQTLADKEMEFNDRLLEESSRSRESVDLKKKLTALERNMAKFQEDAEKARREVEAASVQLEATHQDLATLRGECDEQAAQVTRLTRQLAAVNDEKAALEQSVEQANQAQADFEQERDNNLKARQKAKKAVDIAVQLLEGSGLVAERAP